jgi:hypothetical protein
MAISGKATAQRQAGIRKRFGPGAFGYKGKLYDATSKALDADKRGEVIPEMTGNAADTDQRLISLNPYDFTAMGIFAPPGEDDECTYLGKLFTIKKVLSPELFYGVPISLPVIIYRSPQADAASTAPAAETNPGHRKTYWPAPQL